MFDFGRRRRLTTVVEERYFICQNITNDAPFGVDPQYLWHQKTKV